jgi:hypothetical protein
MKIFLLYSCLCLRDEFISLEDNFMVKKSKLF